MREQSIIQGIQGAHDRIGNVEQRLQSVYKILQDIIGKELIRGQALHKVLKDKALFTDEELKKALETLMEEGKADMKAMEEKAQAEKTKAINLLVPAGANLQPPTEVPTAPAIVTPPVEE